MRQAIAAMSGPLVFIFLLAKGLRGKAFTKEASLFLVVSSSLLAILVTASRQFSWLDVFSLDGCDVASRAAGAELLRHEPRLDGNFSLGPFWIDLEIDCYARS